MYSTCCYSSGRPPMSFAAFNPRILRIPCLGWVVQMLIVTRVHTRGILYSDSSCSKAYTCTIRTRRNRGVINTRWTRRCCHVAGNSTLMIAKEAWRWLLHSTRRVRKIHVLPACSFLVSGEARVEMCVKML